MGAPEATARVQELWSRYLTVSGENRPADYEVCYPQALIDSLAQHCIQGCRVLGIRGFDACNDPAGSIPSLIQDAWERFIVDPSVYGDWERARLEVLRKDLGFA